MISKLLLNLQNRRSLDDRRT